MSASKTVKAMLGGRHVVARPTGNDDKGRPYTGAGYQEATVTINKKKVHGRLCWLSGGWRFELLKEATPE